VSTVPYELGRELRVRVSVGDSTLDVTVSGDLMMRTAADVLVPMLSLFEDDYERRMMRRALMPIVRLAIEQAAYRAAWVEVSRMLQLDPEKGR
jgi:hypothetical protein